MSPPTLDFIPELPPLSQMLRAEEIHPGDVIAGKYRVRAILGRSHGLLVEAFHTEFDQRAIIKVLLAGSGDEREIERFRREARTLAKLESEHVARIIDVGTEADGSFYLVRQFLDGIDLGTYVRQNGPLGLVDAVLTILQVAEAVAETHSHGIIVRELQPGHLFLTQRAGGSPLIRISDFGTAKLMKDAAAPGAGPEVTATAMFGLSPYSSPELLRKARDVDMRADVWSLGAIFYELLTGRPPFSGEATYLMLQITREDPTPPSQIRGDVPPEIDQIISWALAKDVDARFKSVHAFAHALLPYASPEGQLLVERIAQMSNAGKRRGSQPPPAFPSVRPAPMPQAMATQPVAVSERPSSRPSRGQDDSITDVRVPSSAPAVAVTMPSQVKSEAHAMPPPPPGQPVGTLPPQMSDPRWAAAQPASVPPPSMQPQPVMVAPREGGAGRKAALGIIAVSAVLVPILLIMLLLKRTGAPATSDAVTMSTTSAVIAPAATAPAQTETAAPAPSVTATATAAETATAAPAQTAQATAEPSASAEAPDTSAKASHASRTVAVHAAPSPPPAPAPAPAAAVGPNGTLLAMVVGGTCVFSVNGAAKGSGQSIRVPLKPGTYAVVCRGASGSKSKSVTVRSGETAMAAFKL